ncbi:hypothetical protein MKW94_023318 [Papaver nudicaule]|uniref:Transmembrane protein 18 n=1 Tax=Papaver nudicaule TaxID=74823 RepID=A0AA41UUC5_PAPNU|nr:hypothetical protein [Papaver nudicaule]
MLITGIEPTWMLRLLIWLEYTSQRISSRQKSFAGQNYFDPRGIFLSVLWSGPLLIISIIILVNTLFSLCKLMVKWKRAELKHKTRAGRNKQE